MGDIPEARETDHEDVSLALDVARARLANGDHPEALKWLRKAADTAFDAGDDRRGMELSKAAAELKPSSGVAGLKPPPGVTPQPAKAATPSVAPGARPVSRSVAPPAVPKGISKPVVPSSTAQGAKSVPARATPAQTKPRPSQYPPRREPAKPTKPALPKQVVEEEDSTREFVMEDAPKGAPTQAASGDEWPTESGSVGHPGEFTDEMQRVDMAPEPQEMPVSQALRVAVGRNQQGYVVVRPLDENGLAAGEHDAMLVGLMPEADLRELFR
jgi:hypothetical protein